MAKALSIDGKRLYSSLAQLGKIGAYTTMCEQTRGQAYEDMVKHAEALGANAIVGIRYDASSVEPKGASVEVLCYGTAVVVRKK